MMKLKRCKGEDLITSNHKKYSRRTFAMNDLVDAINELQDEVKLLKRKKK